MYGLYEPETELREWCKTISYSEALDRAKQANRNENLAEALYICDKVLNREIENKDPEKIKLQLFFGYLESEISGDAPRQTLETALPLAIEYFGPLDKSVVEATWHLADAYMLSHKYKSVLAASPAKAEKLLKNLLKTQESELGADHKDLIPTLILLEFLYDLRKKVDQKKETEARINKTTKLSKNEIKELRFYPNRKNLLHAWFDK